MEEYILFDEIWDESLITRKQLSNLETRVRNVYNGYSSLEVGLNGGELQSSINLLKKNFSKFIEILDKLNAGYEEYIEKKDIVDSIEGYKHDVKTTVKINDVAEKQLKELDKVKNDLELELLRALGLGIHSDELEFELQKLEREIVFCRLRKIVSGWRKEWLDSVKSQLYSSLWFKLNEVEDAKTLKEYQNVVKRFEHYFEQLKDYGEKIILLWEKIEKMLSELNNPGDSNENGNNRVSNGVNPGVLIEKEGDISEELRNLFYELEKKKINNSRLRSILQNKYNEGKIISSRFIYEWILRYNLTITPKELKWILGEVFTIEKGDNEWLVQLNWEIKDKEVKVESDRVIDSENQDLKDLKSIYNKLKNKEVESKEFYCCFFGILKKYLCLKIDDEEALIKQFKSFEKHNYFYSDIVSVSEDIIGNGMKPSIIWKNAKCVRTWKVIKFPIGLHSKVRIVISDDDRIVGLYSHADYVRYFWWSRT